MGKPVQYGLDIGAAAKECGGAMGLGLGPEVRGVDGRKHDDRQARITLVKPTDRSERVSVREDEIDDDEVELVALRDEFSPGVDRSDELESRVVARAWRRATGGSFRSRRRASPEWVRAAWILVQPCRHASGPWRATDHQGLWSQHSDECAGLARRDPHGCRRLHRRPGVQDQEASRPGLPRLLDRRRPSRGGSPRDRAQSATGPRRVPRGRRRDRTRWRGL